jgi:hypothetical protein
MVMIGPGPRALQEMMFLRIGTTDGGYSLSILVWKGLVLHTPFYWIMGWKKEVQTLEAGLTRNIDRPLVLELTYDDHTMPTEP